MTDPIRKSLHVPLRPKEAFTLFTKNLADWWPVDSHSLSAGDGEVPKDVSVDPQVGGYITETKADGETGRWGTITTWAPGQTLGISWYVGRGEDEATEITVVFTPTDTGTRVDLTHDGFDHLGAAATTMSGQYDVGWDHVLIHCFGTYCELGNPASFATAAATNPS